MAEVTVIDVSDGIAIYRCMLRQPRVLVESRCGGSADCLDDDRILNWPDAYFSAFAWIAPNPDKRYVVFREPKTRAFITRVGAGATGPSLAPYLTGG